MEFSYYGSPWFQMVNPPRWKIGQKWPKMVEKYTADVGKFKHPIEYQRN